MIGGGESFMCPTIAYHRRVFRKRVAERIGTELNRKLHSVNHVLTLAQNHRECSNPNLTVILTLTLTLTTTSNITASPRRGPTSGTGRRCCTRWRPPTTWSRQSAVSKKIFGP
jgi:hypothetical protein